MNKFTSNFPSTPSGQNRRRIKNSKLHKVEKSEKVVHCKKAKFDVYIGRPHKWGNPFIIGKDGDRNEVIDKYRKWIMRSPAMLDSLHELDGKVLGCWCRPHNCHGDVLVELIAKQKL